MDVGRFGGIGHVGLGWGLAIMGWSFLVVVSLLANVPWGQNVLPGLGCLAWKVMVYLLSMFNRLFDGIKESSEWRWSVMMEPMVLL